jgi:hypothetical protein
MFRSAVTALVVFAVAAFAAGTKKPGVVVPTASAAFPQ